MNKEKSGFFLVREEILPEAIKILVDKRNCILDRIKHVIDFDEVAKARMDLVRWMLAILEIHVRHFANA